LVTFQAVISSALIDFVASPYSKVMGTAFYFIDSNLNQRSKKIIIVFKNLAVRLYVNCGIFLFGDS